jgi:hypothetical protein
MPSYEYKVLPAPRKGEKAKGIRTPEGRFANALEKLMNRMGEAGWEFLRAELLPNDERAGLTGVTTEWRNVLVFRREREDSVDAFEPRLLSGPANSEEPEPETPRRSPLSAVTGMTGALLGRGRETPAPEPEPEPDPAAEEAAEQVIAEAETAAEDGALTPEAEAEGSRDEPDAPEIEEPQDDPDASQGEDADDEDRDDDAPKPRT